MILVDTCVISELAKPVPNPLVIAWMDGVSDASLRLSVLTLGEIKHARPRNTFPPLRPSPLSAVRTHAPILHFPRR